MIGCGQSRRFQLRPSYFVNLALLLGIILTTWNVYQLKQLQNGTNNVDTISGVRALSEGTRQRIAWINGNGKNVENNYMKHIFEVFRMLGYHVITGNQTEGTPWDVMWVHEYPFSMEQYRSHVSAADHRQIVNHVPGSGFYTSKVALATANISIGIPQAFQLPAERQLFLEFAKLHPEYFWVQKNNNHRNINIKHVEELDLGESQSFVQRFVDNPLLIDNRKFDIGIYTVVTSLNPLRVYIFDEGLLRFCPQDYHPFDPKNVDKYVVGDDYTPIWEMDSLKHFYVDQKLSFKNSLNAFLKTQGKNPEKIWQKIKETIAEVFYAQQQKMLSSTQSSSLKAKFFELSRFDFVLDDELNVYLMEANMSPNLSSGHFKPNQLLYEQVLLNILSLVGVANQLTRDAEHFMKSRQGIENAIVSDRDMTVDILQCYDGTCSKSCDKAECQLCGHCMSDSTRQILRTLIREHQNKKNMLRISFEKRKPLTDADRLQSLWLIAKCVSSPEWCS